MAVIYATIDRAVLKVLLEARIPVYDSVSHGTYNHGKTLIVSGRLGATDGDLVSQGSANWSSRTWFTTTKPCSASDPNRPLTSTGPCGHDGRRGQPGLPSCCLISTADARAKARLITKAMAEEG